MISDIAGIDQSVWLIIVPSCIIERIETDKSYRVGDVDASQPRAAFERIVANLCYRIGDVDASQPRAVSERQDTDSSYRVGFSIIGDGGRDGYWAGVFIITKSDAGVGALDVVTDAIDLEVVGRGGSWQQEGQH